MICSQLDGEELEKCILQDLESRGYGAFIPLTAKVLLDSVSCPDSSANGEVGQEPLEEQLGSFDNDGFENLSQIHLPNFSDCSFEFATLWECMSAPWGQCGLQVLLTVCLSLCIMSAFLLLFTKNKVVLPWLNKTVRQIATYLQNSRLANLPSRTRASSSISGTRPRNLSNRINPRTIFPKMSLAMRRRLKSSSPNGLSYKVLLKFHTFYLKLIPCFTQVHIGCFKLQRVEINSQIFEKLPYNLPYQTAIFLVYVNNC